MHSALSDILIYFEDVICVMTESKMAANIQSAFCEQVYENTSLSSHLLLSKLNAAVNRI